MQRIALAVMTVAFVLTAQVQSARWVAPARAAVESEYKVEGLCSDVVAVADVEELVGDSEGGIAFNGDKLFVNKDGGVGVLQRTDLTGGVANEDLDGDYQQALVTDLETGTAYVLDYNEEADDTVANLLEIDNDADLVDGAVTELSASIELPNDDAALFNGYGRVVLLNELTGVVYDVEIATGTVTEYTTLPVGSPVLEDMEGNESALEYGVAEYFDGAIWLVYPVSGSNTKEHPDRIVRMNALTGETQDVWRSPKGEGNEDSDMAEVWGMGDDPSFIVDPATHRWYLSTEYGSDNLWIADQFPDYSSYDEPVAVLTTSEDCELTVDPYITPRGRSALVGVTDEYKNTMSRWSWLRCSESGAGTTDKPSDCRMVVRKNGRGSQMENAPYRLKGVDRRMGFMRVAVYSGGTWYYSAAYDLSQ